LGVDEGIWEAPLVGGTPASSLVILAAVSMSVGFAAALLAVVLNFVAPRLMDFWGGSPTAVVVVVFFVVGGVMAGFGFPALFRQANREIAAGYTTLKWSSLRGSVPLVNPRTRRIERVGPPRFDATAARARAPWSSAAASQSKSVPLPPTPRLSRAAARARWAAIAGIVLFAIAIWARVQDGSVSGVGTLLIGAIVIGVLLVALISAALVFRALLAGRLSKVSQVETGIIAACYCAPQTLASSERLGVARGVIPRVAVLVFDTEGFSIWRASGVPTPTVSVTRHDVISLDTTIITSGRTSTTGLEVTVIPPDERWPFLMKFTVFDPSRILAAADEEKLDVLIRSVTDMWSK
jgi:hypothetical protein